MNPPQQPAPGAKPEQGGVAEAFDGLINDALADPSLLQLDRIDGSCERYSVSETGRKLLQASVGIANELTTAQAALTESRRECEDARQIVRKQDANRQLLLSQFDDDVTEVRTQLAEVTLERDRLGMSLEDWKQEASMTQNQIAEREAQIAELREALKQLHDETADYIRINNLGHVYHNRAMLYASIALSKTSAYAGKVAVDSTELAQLRMDRERLEAIHDYCRVTYYPKDGSYPLEHSLAAKKPMWDQIILHIDAARSATQEGK